MNPLQHRSDFASAVLAFVLVTATLVLMTTILALNRALESAASPQGILSLQLSPRIAASEGMVEEWRARGVLGIAVASVLVDFPYAAVYSTVLAISGFLLAKRWLARSDAVEGEGWWPASIRATWWTLSSVALVAAWLQWLAGLLDMVENCLLLLLLRGQTDQWLAPWTFWCATTHLSLTLVLGVPLLVMAVAFRADDMGVLFNRTYRPWLDWPIRYPPLVAVIAVLIWVTSDTRPSSPGLGVQFLFWHDDPSVQFWAGFFVAILIGELWFVGYLLDRNEAWLADLGPASNSDDATVARIRRRRMLLHLAFTAGPLFLLTNSVAAGDLSRRGVFLAGSCAGAVAMVATWLLLRSIAELVVRKPMVERYQRTVHRSGPIVQAAMRLPDEPELAQLHFVASGLFLVFTGLLLFAVWKQRSAALAICVVLALLMIVYGRLLYAFPRRWLGAVLAAGAVAVALAGRVDYPHRFRGLEPYYAADKRVDLARFEEESSETEGEAAREVERATGTGPRNDNQELLDAWLRRQTRSSREKPKLVVVAISGGGIRAATWAMVVLTAIEHAHPDFPYEVRLVTGTSGGMLGGAFYVASLPPPDGESSQPKQSRNREELDELISQIATEGLSETVWTFVMRDLPSLGYWPDDRGFALERVWERNTHGVLQQSLASLADGERNGWRPSLVFSPMLVEDGRRLLISNLNLDRLESSVGLAIRDAAAPESTDYSRAAVQFYELFPGARDSFRLSTAIRMNASFPYVSPVGVLPTIPPRRIVDAAYYDNFGVNVAALWLDDLVRTNWLQENTSGVVLVQIIDHPTEEDRSHLVRESEHGQPRSGWAKGQDGVRTPLDAVLSARGSTMQFRNDEQVQQLDERLNTEERPRFFTSVTFEFAGSVSLSWYLTRREISQLRSGMGELSEDLTPEEERILENGSRQNARRLAHLVELLK